MKNYLISFFVILIIVIVYLIFFSQRSIFTYFDLKKELDENKEVLNTLEKQSKELQNNIEKIKSKDLEYIDKLAREKYDMSEPDENIIFNNN